MISLSCNTVAAYCWYTAFVFTYKRKMLDTFALLFSENLTGLEESFEQDLENKDTDW